MRISSFKSLLAVSAVAVGLAGCNTVSGVGKDIAGLGNFIAGGAGETQQAIFGPGEGYGSPGTFGQNYGSSPQTGMNSGQYYYPPNASYGNQNSNYGNSNYGNSNSANSSDMNNMSNGKSSESVVYFGSGSSHLTSANRNELREALAEQRVGPETRIRVVGYTDSVGSPNANDRLSQRRAEAVAQELASLGVPRDRVEVNWVGEQQALMGGDEVPSPENRRVEIQYASTVAQNN